MKWSEFFCVIKPSPLGGVGVFATCDIHKNTQLFTNPFKIRLLKSKDIPEEFIQYCARINDTDCLCPERFDRMEIGWYINHSFEPNIARKSVEYTAKEIHREKARPFYAVRDIRAGEEILVDYTYLKEPEHLKEEFYKTLG